MKLVLATPLFPPDIGDPAPYSKEVARRLASSFTTAVVTYGSLPEEVTSVRIVSVNRSVPTLLRVILYTLKLASEAREADCIYLQNGPSTELSALLVSVVLRKKLVYALSDQRVLQRESSSILLSILRRLVSRVAAETITDFPNTRPEILPFSDSSVEMNSHEKSWETHIHSLTLALEYHD